MYHHPTDEDLSVGTRIATGAPDTDVVVDLVVDRDGDVF
jgi:hypothetical protein